MGEITTNGPYYPIPGTDGLEVNASGVVKEQPSGRFLMPIKREGRIYYQVNDRLEVWCKRVYLMKIAGFEVLDGKDRHLYQTIRSNVSNINKRKGFSTHTPGQAARNRNAPYEKGASARKPGSTHDEVKQELTDKPCPDGRSEKCMGYLPRGYYARCPQCWARVQDSSGYCAFDYGGRRSWGD